MTSVGRVVGGVEDVLGDGDEGVAGGGGGVVEDVAGLFGAAVLDGDEDAFGACGEGGFVVVGLKLVASLLGGGEDVGSDDGVGGLAGDDRAWDARFGALNRNQRTAVVLRHVVGLGIVEISESTGRPEGTVKADIHRGLEKLREIMEKEE